MVLRWIAAVSVALLIFVMSMETTFAVGPAPTATIEPQCGVLRINGKKLGVRQIVGQNATYFKIIDPKQPAKVVLTPKSKTNPKEGKYLLSIRNCSFYGIGTAPIAEAPKTTKVSAASTTAPTATAATVATPVAPQEEEPQSEPWQWSSLITPALVVMLIALVIFLCWQKIVGLYHKLR